MLQIQLLAVANGFQEMKRNAGHRATPPLAQTPLRFLPQLSKCGLAIMTYHQVCREGGCMQNRGE